MTNIKPTNLTQTPLSSEEVVKVLPWTDGVIDNIGHDPDSLYVELFWLPIIGPSCLWLLKRLGMWLAKNPKGYEIELKLLAKEIGLIGGNGTGQPLKRSMSRCTDFGIIHMGPNNCMFVRNKFPELPPRLVSRLSYRLKIAHEKFSGVSSNTTDAKPNAKLSIAENKSNNNSTNGLNNPDGKNSNSAVLGEGTTDCRDNDNHSSDVVLETYMGS